MSDGWKSQSPVFSHCGSFHVSVQSSLCQTSDRFPQDSAHTMLLFFQFFSLLLIVLTAEVVAGVLGYVFRKDVS